MELESGRVIRPPSAPNSNLENYDNMSSPGRMKFMTTHGGLPLPGKPMTRGEKERDKIIREYEMRSQRYPYTYSRGSSHLDNLDGENSLDMATSYRSDKSIEKEFQSTRGSEMQLRSQVRSTERLKHGKDVANILKVLAKQGLCKATADMINSRQIPILKEDYSHEGLFEDDLQIKLNDSTFQNSSADSHVEGGKRENNHSTRRRFNPSAETMSIMGGSSILKSLNTLPRIDDMNAIKKMLKANASNSNEGDKNQLNNKKKGKKGAKKIISVDEEERNAKLVRALDMMKHARDIVDSSRLYFEAGVLLDEIEVYDKAVYSFERAAKIISAELVVDTYDLPETLEYKRKVERMSGVAKVLFFERRNKLRKQLIFAEEERQRLRSIVSNCQLLRIYLKIGEYTKAHQSLTAAFASTSTTAEHSELLHYTHKVLRDFALSGDQEIPNSEQILRGNGGPLAEAHMTILHELLEEDAGNPEVLQWLGVRYSQRGDFASAREYYVKYRQTSGGDLDAPFLLKMWSLRPPLVDEEQQRKAASKEIHSGYRNDRETIYFADGKLVQTKVTGRLPEDVFDHNAKAVVKPIIRFGADSVKRKSSSQINLKAGALKTEEVSHNKSLGPDGGGSNVKKNIDNDNIVEFPGQRLNKHDHAWFQGMHEDAATIIFNVPPYGWDRAGEYSLQHQKTKCDGKFSIFPS